MIHLANRAGALTMVIIVGDKIKPITRHTPEALSQADSTLFEMVKNT